MQEKFKKVGDQKLKIVPLFQYIFLFKKYLTRKNDHGLGSI